MPLLSEGFGRMSMQDQAKFHVRTWLQAHLDKSDPTFHLRNDDIYVVWFTKTLQNWKALVSTTLPDGMYYEVTYNGDKHETYLDAYKKFDNVCIPDGQDVVPAERVVAAMQAINAQLQSKPDDESDDGVVSFRSGLVNTSKYNPAGPDRFA